MPPWIARWSWILAAVAVCIAIIVPLARAAPVAVLRQGDLVLTLTDEPCALPAIANLPSRVVWVEKGETIEGCYGRRGETILFYFADLTVIDIPMQAFRLAVGV